MGEYIVLLSPLIEFLDYCEACRAVLYSWYCCMQEQQVLGFQSRVQAC
jgi:hypothetical protein